VIFAAFFVSGFRSPIKRTFGAHSLLEKQALGLRFHLALGYFYTAGVRRSRSPVSPSDAFTNTSTQTHTRLVAGDVGDDGIVGHQIYLAAVSKKPRQRTILSFLTVNT
jgi:hypothetical protein